MQTTTLERELRRERVQGVEVFESGVRFSKNDHHVELLGDHCLLRVGADVWSGKVVEYGGRVDAIQRQMVTGYYWGELRLTEAEAAGDDRREQLARRFLC